MHYRVRNADGELGFQGIADLSRAYDQGMVDDTDEVSVDGGEWRKVTAVPELRGLLGRPRAAAQASVKRWYLVAAAVAGIGLVILAFTRGFVMAGIALVLSAALSSWVAIDAQRKRRRAR